MYTFTIKEKQKQFQEGRFSLVLTVSDGTDSFDRVFSFGLNTKENDIKKVLKNFLDELNAVETLFESIPDTGDYDTTIAPPDPVVKTPEEIAIEDYAKARADLVMAKEDYDLGLLTKSEYDALVAKAKNKKV